MWHRIQYDSWTDLVPIIAFVCTFSVFLVLSIRALMMKKKDAARLAHLPLEEQPGDAPADLQLDRPRHDSQKP